MQGGLWLGDTLTAESNSNNWLGREESDAEMKVSQAHISEKASRTEPKIWDKRILRKPGNRRARRYFTPLSFAWDCRRQELGMRSLRMAAEPEREMGGWG